MTWSSIFKLSAPSAIINLRPLPLCSSASFVYALFIIIIRVSSSPCSANRNAYIPRPKRKHQRTRLCLPWIKTNEHYIQVSQAHNIYHRDSTSILHTSGTKICTIMYEAFSYPLLLTLEQFGFIKILAKYCLCTGSSLK